MYNRSLATVFASIVNARATSLKRGNTEWFASHTERLTSLVSNHMPSGSGFDNGTSIDLDKSTDERLVFHTSFHHMDPNGYYCGWTEHTITVRASLVFGITIAISGRDRNGFKEYAHDVLHSALTQAFGTDDLPVKAAKCAHCGRADGHHAECDSVENTR